MHFLKEQFKYTLMVWLLNSVAADLIKVFAISKTFTILICINTKLRCIEGYGLL